MQAAARVMKKQATIFLVEMENSGDKLQQRLNEMIRDDTNRKSGRKQWNTLKANFSRLNDGECVTKRDNFYQIFYI